MYPETSVQQNKYSLKVTLSEQGAFSLDLLTHAFCFLSILLIGADTWGIDVGVNLRFDQIFLCIFTLLLVIKNHYRLTWNIWIILFAVFALISTLFSFNLKRGILFYCSIIYNILFLFYAFQSYVKIYGFKKLIGIFRKTLYVQFCIIVIQFLLKVVFDYEVPFMPGAGEYMGIPRFSLWFYEPSYLATYLTFWFTLSLYMWLVGKDRSYIKDVLFGLVMFLLATSTTGFLGIILAVVLVYIIWLSRGITFKKLMFPLIVLFAFLIFRIAFSSVYTVFFERLFNQSLDSASGGRISLWTETWNVFVQNPLFGVGPGNYGLYLGQDAGKVPSNVTLELMATLGIFATVVFYGLTISLCVKSFKMYRKARNKETALLAAAALAFIVFTIILQANQGYLRLYHWLFFGMLSGGISSSKIKTESQRSKA